MKDHTSIKSYYIAILIGIPYLAFNYEANATTYDALNGQFEYNIDDSLYFDKLPSSVNPTFDSFEALEKNNKNQKVASIINHIKQQQYKNAYAEISALLKQTPNDAALYNLLALTNKQEGKSNDAKENFKKALKLDNKNIVAIHGLAEIALTEGQILQAKEYFNSILQIDDSYVKAYVALAAIAKKQGDLKDTEALLEKGYEKTQNDFKPTLAIAKALSQLYADQKNIDKLNTLADDIVKKHPNEDEAFAFKINALILSNQPQQAEKLLVDMITRKPNEMIHRVALIKLISEQPGRERDVIDIADQIIALNPEKLQAYILKATYLIGQKLYPQALEVSDQIQQLFPKYSISQQLKGQVYLATGETAKALVAYQQANKIQPESKFTLIIANLMHKQGQTKDAIELLTSELDKNPKLTDVRVQLAALYQQQGETAKAKQHYESALKQQADNVIALNNLALLYLRENNPKALELAEHAYRLAPTSVSTTDTYGYALIKNGKSQEGLSLLQKAALAAPTATDIRYHLAEGLALSNDTEEAVKILDTLIKENESFPEREQASKLLENLRK